MPTHTAVSALIKLYFAVKGAPWMFTQWQEITGVRHGLNPDNDEHLPSDLSREEVESIMLYFLQYKEKASEEEKIKFASKAKKNGKDPIPGRGLWQSWVTKHYSTHWKVNTRIAKILSSLGLHPEQLMTESGETTPPNSSSYLPIALETIARELFGSDALDSHGRLLSKLREPTLVLAQRTWMLEVKSIGSRKKRVEKLKAKAEETLHGAHSSLTSRTDRVSNFISSSHQRR